MKKKLNIAFGLITLSIIATIVFQLYWTINAYHVNKKTFENKIDLAMQQAMDSCKKHYFDSIRVMLVKRLGDTPAVWTYLLPVCVGTWKPTLMYRSSIFVGLAINWFIEQQFTDIKLPFSFFFDI